MSSAVRTPRAASAAAPRPARPARRAFGMPSGRRRDQHGGGAAAEPRQRQRPDRALAGRRVRRRSRRPSGCRRRASRAWCRRRARRSRRAARHRRRTPRPASLPGANSRSARSASGSAGRAGSEAITRMPWPSPGSETREQLPVKFAADGAQLSRAAARRPAASRRGARSRRQAGPRHRSSARPARPGVAAPSSGRAGRIRPEHTACVRRPQPRRDRAHRIGRKPRIAREAKNLVGSVHRFARSTRSTARRPQRKQTLNKARLFCPVHARSRAKSPRIADNLNAGSAWSRAECVAKAAFRAMMASAESTRRERQNGQ